MNTPKILLIAFIMTVFSAPAGAQVSKDSINTLVRQKAALELSARINAQKIQLAKLENDLYEKSREKENTASDAQKAATENAEAAAKLRDNPQDKSLARKAENAGDAARKSAKRARQAADNLEELKKDIESLKNKISQEAAKLAENPVAIPSQQ